MKQRASTTTSQPLKLHGKRTFVPIPGHGRPAAELMKNLAMSAALVVCVVALRSGAVPEMDGPVDAVLTAMTGDTLLDDRLGKLSFVANMFPDTVLVFGQGHSGEIALPVMSGRLDHAWTGEEPYTTWQTNERSVYAAVSGEVSGVIHGMGEELLVQVTTPDGLTAIHGNLAQCLVATGDRVEQGQTIGTLLPGEQLAFEVRRRGVSVDPVPLLPSVP